MQDYPNKKNQGGGFNKNAQKEKGNFSNVGQVHESAAERKFKELIYNPEWIKKEVDKDLIVYAEKAGEFMAKKGLTHAKVRSIYGEMKRIQMNTFEKEKSAFVLLRPKVAYAFGREDRNRNDGFHLFKLIFDRCVQDVSDQKSFLNCCHFMEAILAYHKANGGKD